MLANVVGNYIDSLIEREFDEPFLALLRLLGFYDIHFVHGSFEFGKDFIAKFCEDGIVAQYVFQTKAGDIGLSLWNEARGQIDMLRTDTNSHPNFNALLPRKARFVTTGRLTGGAPIAAQNYGSYLSSRGELDFEIWDRQTLVEMIVVRPEALSSSSPSLLGVLGKGSSELSLTEIERFSRGWIRQISEPSNLRDVLEAALLSSHCRTVGRNDLACYVPLMLVRSILATNHGRLPLPGHASIALNTAKELFHFYAHILWDAFQEKALDEHGLFQAGPYATLISYPVHCSIIVEILGLLALLVGGQQQQQIGTQLAQFIRSNAGVSHPLSDKWAAPLIPAALTLLRAGDSATAKLWLKDCVIWICDRYDRGEFGLATPLATPGDEARRILGSHFDFITEARRSESYLATLILDLCFVFDWKDLYSDVLNDFLAVGITFPLVETMDTMAQYSVDLTGAVLEPNVRFRDLTAVIEDRLAAHHVFADPYFPELAGGPWCQLVLSSVTRDRYYLGNIKRILTA